MMHIHHEDAAVRFEGRSRTETKRKALAYWIDHQDRLRLSLREFLGGCAATPDGLVISFRMPTGRSRARARAASGTENLAEKSAGDRKLRDRAASFVRAFWR